MKFLVDNQLPTALARWLSARGLDAVHVLDRGIARDDDRRLWEIALAESRIVISKDEDFFTLATRPDEQGRLLWVRCGNCRKKILIGTFENAWPAIQEAFSQGQRIVELR